MYLVGWLTVWLVGATPIQIGVLWPESREIDSLSLAVKHAGTQPYGNITVELIWRTLSDATVEAAMDRMVATSARLIGFVGPLSSDEARFAARVADRVRLPVLSPSATAAQLDNPTWFTFFRRPIASDAYSGEALVAFLHSLGFGEAWTLERAWFSRLSYLQIAIVDIPLTTSACALFS